MRRLLVRPLVGANERDVDVDLFEEARARTPASELDDPQLAFAACQLHREPDVADELDAEIGQLRPPAEVDGAGRDVAEREQVPGHRGPVQVTLFGFELARLDERLRARWAELGVREAGVGDQAVGNREAPVALLVRVPLPAPVLAREPAPAHRRVVGTAQMRGRHPRQLVVVPVHDPDA